MKKYVQEHETILAAVRKAAEAVMRFYTHRDYEVAHKDAENPVTDADFAANEILISALAASFPDDGILSEETESEAQRESMHKKRLQRNRVWIIDPIDGTREFIKGRPEFGISIGLVENGTPVLGFVANPARNFLLSGGPTLGLFRNGVKIDVPERLHSTPPRIVISRSEFKSGRLGHLISHYPELGSHAIGSIAYKLALLADGSYDLCVSVRPKNEWDIAGGAALVAAAGLKLYQPDYTPFTFNKPKTESKGVVAGTEEACSWYRKLA